MVVIDLNRQPLPSLSGTQPGTAVFAGVLEYVSDVPAVLRWAARHFEVCIASYECADPKPGILGRLHEMVERTHNGWVNHYTESELKTVFDKVGYQFIERATWGIDDPGQIFVFKIAGEERDGR
jgi:hypothetical protein